MHPKIALFLIPIALIAGCTGYMVKDFDIEKIEIENISNGSQNYTQNYTQNYSNVENVNFTENLCQNITCVPNKIECPDGFLSSCSNICDPKTGQCSNCIPSCAGHEKICNLTCQICEQLNNSTCKCEKVQPCCGNGLCEQEENYSLCPSDCKQIESEQIELKVYISEIMYNPIQDDDYNEWIEIYNPGTEYVDMTGWTLCGKAILPGYIDREGQVHNETGLSLPPKGRAIITDGGSGTDVYNNFNVQPSLALHVNASSICNKLANTNRTIELTDSKNYIIDNVTYYSEWGANGNGKSLTKSGNEWIESEPSPGS